MVPPVLARHDRSDEMATSEKIGIPLLRNQQKVGRRQTDHEQEKDASSSLHDPSSVRR